jgi:PST family polysaccharide transporter
MTGVYSLYVLPKYAKIKSLNTFKLELVKIYKFVIPVFCLLFLGVFVFRIFIIKLLYSDEFLPMAQLFKWQLFGDLIKIIAVVLAYQFIAQKKWKLFIITEAVSYLLLYIFGIYFVNKMGVEGIVFAHFLRYVIYLIIIIFTVKYSFKTNNNLDESNN